MNDTLIPSTKDRPGSYDAIETAKPGEPLFPIQGGDPFGPPTVLHWARLAREAGMREPDEKKAGRLLRKASDAEQVAWAMDSYQRGQPEDAPEGRPARYNDADPADDEPDHGRAERETRIKGTGRLHNIIGLAADLADDLARFESCHRFAERMRGAIAAMKELAGEIEPRRANERS